MGRFAAKGGNYKFSSGVCIVAFTFVLGSRYMRGNDYAHYVDVFNRRTEVDQHLFTWLNDSLSAIGFSGYGAFYVYALIFSCCLFYLLRRFKEYAAYMFPIALIALVFFHEYMIRQALSFSFVFLFVDQLLSLKNTTRMVDDEDEETNSNNDVSDLQPSVELYDNFPLEDSLFEYEHDGSLLQNNKAIEWKHAAFCVVIASCALSIHTANLVIIGIIFLFWFFSREKTIPFYFSIPLLFLCALYINKALDLDTIAPYIQLLQGTDTKLDSYIEKSEYWFGEEGTSDEYTRSGIILMLELWGYSALFWLCDRMSKQIKFNSVFAIALNSLIVGSLIMITFRELEILNRMGYVLSVFWFIPISISLYHIKEFQFKYWEKVFLIGLAWWLYEYLKYLFLRNEGMTLFLWDMT